MLLKTNVDISIKIQPPHPPFCSFVQTRGICNEYFNWPDVANFLVLMLRFVFTRRKRTQEKAQAQGKGKSFDPCACAYAFLNLVFMVKEALL